MDSSEYFYLIIIVYIIYSYTQFCSVNPSEYAKLIDGIDGIDGKRVSLKYSSAALSLYTKAFREVAVKYCK